MITLLHIDCMEYMATVPDKYFDLCITSPPYNLGNNHHTGNYKHNPYPDDLPEEIYQKKQLMFLTELYRIIADDGSLFYNHKNRIKDGVSISPYNWIFKSKWLVKQELVWFNGSQNFDKCRFYPMTERIYWLSKSIKTKFINNISHHDLFDWNAEGTNKEHTRTFPIKMPIDILKCFPPNIKVFDPYCGLGTVATACYDFGTAEFVGCEIDKDYFDAAAKRFNTHKLQQKLPL